MLLFLALLATAGCDRQKPEAQQGEAAATPLTGTYVREETALDLESVVRVIGDVEREEAAKRMRLLDSQSA